MPADHTDSAGFELSRFITARREAHAAGRLEPEWTAELDALGMIWDKHDAAWRAHLTTTTAYHRGVGRGRRQRETPGT
ncbi:helicase associated domain-containing protein [Streptomyces violascens]|uniref:helicase associated domain-containing protein n=1 Tax=Streptomyces violascens TaxID=67381 RepID=UPI00365C3806